MKLKTDHCFHIGEQHLKQGKPCQDYALSGMFDDTTAYAIVSDGCSSGGMTDIGSRLMSLATVRALRLQLQQDGLCSVNVSSARDAYLESYRSSLQLESRDLLATNLWAVITADQVTVSMAGDGVAALSYENDLIVTSYEWQQNTPYYPAYRIGGLDPAFAKLHSSDLYPLTQTTELLHTKDNEINTLSLTEGMQDIQSVHPTQDKELGKLQTIALFSDGVEQVDQFDRVAVVKSLLAFKSTNGQFAVRRMNRFLQETKKVGRGPLDDIACAIIHLES